MKRKTFITFVVMALLVGLLATTAVASPGADEPDLAGRIDNRHDPLSDAQAALKVQALDAAINGKAYGRTHEVARGQFVELEREGEGVIWTVLGEFADLAHNTMPEPDRTVDNTTIWVPDFSRDHYMDMLFNEAPGANSMRNFYIEQSSNRYTVNGDVTDWVAVPGDAATYDDDFASPLGGNQVWYFLDDSVDGWYAAQIAAGQTPAEINTYLAAFDVSGSLRLRRGRQF